MTQNIKQKAIEAMREAPLAFVDNSELGDIIFQNMLDAALTVLADRKNWTSDMEMSAVLSESNHALMQFAAVINHIKGLPV